VGKRLPELVRKKLWKLGARKRGAAYSTLRESPTVVCVLENGSKVVHRAKVAANDAALYVIHDGWLVEETAPAEVARVVADATKRKAAAAAKRKATAAVSGAPAFQTVLAELARELGAAKKVRVIDVSMWAFPAPDTDGECTRWSERVSSAGGAATVYADYTGTTLRVVAGRASRFGALFGHEAWLNDDLGAILDALDDDAGLRVVLVAFGGSTFELALERPPKDVQRHATALARVARAKPAAVAKALRARAWHFEAP